MRIFSATGVNFQAVNARPVSAIYDVVLHAKTNGSTICEIDVNTKDGRRDVLQALDLILEWCYREGKHPGGS